MIQTTIQRADINMQHRVLNAMIKENIFPEGTRIDHYDGHLDVQFKGRVLSVQVTGEAAFKRYTMNGPLAFQIRNQEVIVQTLEQLLKILEEEFEVTIPERLEQELIHSRRGFDLTYAQMDQRRKLIHDSMKFSRMPVSLNYFAWMQHMSALDEMNDLLYSESLAVEGHPTHPLSKTKLPLSNEEVERYAPEFEKVIPLKVMLIRKEDAIATSASLDPDFMLNEVLRDEKQRLKHFVKALNLKLEDYDVVIVHPWQYEHVIIDRFKDWIQERRLIPTPITLPSKATLSFRTMALLNRPFHIKLPVEVQATSAVRTVSSVTTKDGPKLSYELQDMLHLYPQLKIAKEPYGLHADVEADKARQLAYIVREKPFIDGEGVTVVTASLVNPNPIDDHTIVDSYLEWVDNEISKNTIKQFITVYAHTLIPPLIAYIQDYGIALEAHMQNTIVKLGKDYRMAFAVRDLGGSRIDLPSLQEKLPNVEVENQSLIADQIEDVIAKFQHAVIQNQMGELTYHFQQYECIDENEMFEIIRHITLNAIDPNKPHADILKKVLFAKTMKVKSLMRMRMEGKVKKYVNTEVANPLWEGE
ncbi:IucA/IucC family protein [Staphylococcus debuckii]|uniref:IucA/IucC family protein n=1 Tax=Staphylococcus debuckii TaxID=2044912 RepID=A0ABU9F110_9STAP